MKRSRIICVWCVAFFVAVVASTKSYGQSVDPNRERAIALWEEAVRAKGGRERLHSIRNFLISSTLDVQDKYGYSAIETERLYVMPGKAWIYTYTPDVTVSLDVTVINKERQFCWVTLWPKSYGVPPLSPCIPSTPIKFLVQDPVIYLMETDSMRPEPLRVRTEGKGKKQIDVIETRIANLRVDFYLDRKTRLPRKLVTEWYGGIAQATDGGGPMTVELDDYVEIEGIMMPRRVTREPTGRGAVRDFVRRDTERATYRFNVVYEANIFAGPAPKKTKRSDWKVKDKNAKSSDNLPTFHAHTINHRLAGPGSPFLYLQKTAVRISREISCPASCETRCLLGADYPTIASLPDYILPWLQEFRCNREP